MVLDCNNGGAGGGVPVVVSDRESHRVIANVEAVKAGDVSACRGNATGIRRIIVNVIGSDGCSATRIQRDRDILADSTWSLKKNDK